MAWLHQVPDKQSRPRAETLPANDSRRELPELDYGWHVVEALSSLEFCRQGPAPIDYQEIRAWQDLTGSELTPWEAETLISMSSAYAVQLMKSKDPRADAPFWKTNEGVDVTAKLKALARRKRNG